MKGIILAGGSGTRLYPATRAVCKQLLPIYDKPMIYYPLSTLMWGGIKEILIISTPQDTPRFKKLLGSGEHLGLHLHYAVQAKPKGIAEALLIAEKFFADDNIALILGDNLFFGAHFPELIKGVIKGFTKGAAIFGYRVSHPNRYGVLSFDENNKPVDIIEKPKVAPSKYAVSGLYIYDADAFKIAQNLAPSQRNELEITDINRTYLQQNNLQVHLMGQGYAWLDTGTFDALHQASTFVQTIQERQGIKIACIEEIAYTNGWITLEALMKMASYYKNAYGSYLKDLIDQKFSNEMVER